MQTWLNLTTQDKIISMVLLCLGVSLVFVIIGIFAKFFSVEKVSKEGIQFSSNKKDKNKKEDETTTGAKRPTLLEHRFFQLMDLVKMEGYIMSDTPDTDKKTINIVFLQKCLFYVINKGIKEFFKEMEATEGATLYMLPSTILTLMNEYTEKASNIKIDLKDGTTIYGVPNCYISRFNSWNYEPHKVLMESIQDVISDAFYTDWYMKCVASLDYLYNCYALTIYNANRTLGQLNGNLEAEIELIKNRIKESN